MLRSSRSGSGSLCCMAIESAAFVPQVVDTLHSWCTPTVLFVLLNIVIGTIVVTSRMRLNQNEPNNLRRTPSLLSRLGSINFRKTYADEPVVTWIAPPEPAEAAEENAIVERDAEMEEKRAGEAKIVDDGGGSVPTTGLSKRAVIKKSALGRSKSDSQPLVDLTPPPPLPGKMHKYGTFEGGNYARKAATVVAPPKAAENVEEEENGSDGEVNAKADDFINKFKQQLKLQRLESLMRSKEMFGRT